MRNWIFGVAAASLVAGMVQPGPAEAFERVEGRKVVVFGGRQAIPVLDPHCATIGRRA